MSKLSFYLSIFAAILSGFSIFINKFGVAVVNPTIFSWLKNSAVAIMLLGSLWFFKDWSLIKSLTGLQWLKLIFIGLVGGAMAFTFYFEGLALTSAAQASFWHKTLFIWSTLLAIVFLKEIINANYITAGLLILLGNLLLLKLLPVEFNKGDGLVLLATFLWSIEIIVSKNLLTDLPVRVIIWARMFFGSVLMSFWLIVTGQLSFSVTLDLNQLGWVMLTAILLLGYLITWYSGLKLLKVSMATALLSLGGLITASLNFFALKQPLSQFQLIGFMVLLIGVLMILLNQYLKIHVSALDKNEA